MPYETVTAGSVEEARSYAARGGRYLALSPEILQQIEDAEAAGGFEGGLTGSSDGAPYSAAGHGGGVASSASDLPRYDDGLGEDFWAMKAITLDDAVERALDLKDVYETWIGRLTGPVILVPTRELQRWLGVGDSADGA